MTAAQVPDADLHEIEQLKYRYLRTLDTKDWDGFAATLLPEATGSYGGLALASREAIVSFMRENLPASVVTLHQVHHPEIEVDGDRATGCWYLQDKVIATEHDVVIEGAAFYRDEYRRTPDGWRIAATGYERTYEASWSTADLPGWRITPP